MADEAPEEQPAEEPKADDPKVDVGKEIEQLRADVAKYKETAERAQVEAERSKSYLGAVVGKIQEVAAKAKPASKEEIRERLSEDPEAVLDEMFQARVAPLLQENYKNLDATSREVTKQKLGETWKTYEKEVDEFMGNMPMDVRARPDAWESALAYVRSRHIDEEVEARVKRKLDKSTNMENASPSSPSKPARRGLSTDEKAIAKGLEISEEDWVKQRDKIVSGTVTHGS